MAEATVVNSVDAIGCSWNANSNGIYSLVAEALLYASLVTFPCLRLLSKLELSPAGRDRERDQMLAAHPQAARHASQKCHPPNLEQLVPG